jgi:MFS family permease
VQEVSVIQTSLYFLPNVLMGVFLNVFTGLLVHRIRADHLVLSSAVISAVAPLLMAIINREWSWWWCAFWAMLLLPPSADSKSNTTIHIKYRLTTIPNEVIFTVANLIITDVFPPNTQALAGAVFNTVSQFGTSIGITIAAIISASVTNKSSYTSKNSPDALMLGYRAVFWTCFGIMILACGVGAVGLRKVGKVGLKRE